MAQEPQAPSSINGYGFHALGCHPNTHADTDANSHHNPDADANSHSIADSPTHSLAIAYSAGGKVVAAAQYAGWF